MKMIIALIMTFGAAASWACSCADMNAQDLLKHSDKVFLGMPAQDSVSAQRPYDDWIGQNGVSTKFNVIANYKNTAPAGVTLISKKGNGANCGINFKAYSGTYIVSAYTDPATGETVTSACDVRMLASGQAYKLMLELEALSNH